MNETVNIILNLLTIEELDEVSLFYINNNFMGTNLILPELINKKLLIYEEEY